MNLAPVALFVYNRPKHTLQTLEALQRNSFAPDTDLCIFSDAPKIDDHREAVLAVRRLISRLDGFHSVTVVERVSNLGLARSIIGGVTQLIEEYGRVIVLEDDLATSPRFLTFMNEALDFYESDPRVGSITGYSLPVSIPRNYSRSVYLTHRHSSWGWGTYGRVWRGIDWDVSDYGRFRRDYRARRAFNVAGPDMATMLDLQMAGKIDSWSIRFDYACFKRGALSLAPVANMVMNIGFDGSGVHCGPGGRHLQGSLGEGCNPFFFNHDIELDPAIVKSTRRLFRNGYLRTRVRIFLESVMNFYCKSPVDK